VPGRPRRVRKSGNLARTFVIPPGIIFVLATAVGMQAPREFTAGEWVLITLFIAVPTIVVALSLFIGVWMTTDGVTIRSWFETRRYQRSEIASFDLEEYRGGWNMWPFNSAFLVLVVELVDGPVGIFPSTIATHRSLVEQIRQLDEHLGTQSFAARLSQSPAAMRDARSRAWKRSRRSRDEP
jgi:hypothetical protein